MPMIRECIVTTLSEEGSVHIAPLGLIAEEGGFIIAPFRPSERGVSAEHRYCP